MTVLLPACLGARAFSFDRVSGIGFTPLESLVFQHGVKCLILTRGLNLSAEGGAACQLRPSTLHRMVSGVEPLEGFF